MDNIDGADYPLPPPPEKVPPASRWKTEGKTEDSFALILGESGVPHSGLLEQMPPAHPVESSEILKVDTPKQGLVLDAQDQKVAFIKQLTEGGNTLKELCAEIKETSKDPKVQAKLTRLSTHLDRALQTYTTRDLNQALSDPQSQQATLLEASVTSRLQDAWTGKIMRAILSDIEKEALEEMGNLSIDEEAKTTLIQDFKAYLEAAHLIPLERSYRTSLGGSLCADLAGASPNLSSIQSRLNTALLQERSSDLQKSEHNFPAEAPFKEIVKQAVSEIADNPDMDPSLVALNHLLKNEEQLRSLFSQRFEAKRAQMPFNSETISKILTDHIRDKFRTAAAVNPANSVSEFSDILRDSDTHTTAIAIGSLLQNCALRDIGPEYQFATNLLRTEYPELNDYLQDFGKKREILSPAGVAILLEMLKEKGKLNDVPCHICLTPEQAGEHLSDLIHSENGRMGLIIQVREPLHYFAMVAEKSEKGVRLAITDSFPSDAFHEGLLNEIVNRFCSTEMTIFKPGFQRQTDTVSCPIFALRDTSQFCQHPEILDQIELSAKPQSADESSSPIRLVEFSRFPPALMKATQSLSAIRAYDQTAETPDVLSELKDHGRIHPVPDPTEEDPHAMKDANTLINERNLKYARIMYSAAIAFGLVHDGRMAAG